MTLPPDKVLALAREAHGPITGQWFDMDIAALTRFTDLIQQALIAEGWRSPEQVKNDCTWPKCDCMELVENGTDCKERK